MRKNSKAMRCAAVGLAGLFISSQTYWNPASAEEFSGGSFGEKFGQMPFNGENSGTQGGGRPSGGQSNGREGFSGMDFSGMMSGFGEIAESAEIGTLSGTTTMDTVSQHLELAVNYARLSVEAVYVESGDTVEKGDPLYKISDEDMNELGIQLEKKIKSAKEALTQAEIDYEKGISEAKYTKEAALANGELAQSEHEKKQQELQDNVDSNYKTLGDTQEKITELETDLQNGITTTTERVTIPTITYSFANKVTNNSGDSPGTMGNMNVGAFSSSGAISGDSMSSSGTNVTVSDAAGSLGANSGVSGMPGGMTGNFGGSSSGDNGAAGQFPEIGDDNFEQPGGEMIPGENQEEESSEEISSEEISSEEISGEEISSEEESSEIPTGEIETSEIEPSESEYSFSEKLMIFEREWGEKLSEQETVITELRTQLGELEASQLELILIITETVNSMIQNPSYMEKSETFWEESKQGQMLNAIKQVMSQTITMSNQEAAAEAQTLIETIEEAMTEEEETETGTEEEETSTEDTETGAEETETSAEETETSAEETETSTEEAETSTEEAETSTEEAETSAEEAETSTEEAETSAEETETSTEEAETSIEEAETSTEETESEEQTVTKYKVTVQTQTVNFSVLLSVLNDYIELYDEQCMLEEQLNTAIQLMEELETQKQDAWQEFAEAMEQELQSWSESAEASYEARIAQAVSEAVASAEAEQNPEVLPSPDGTESKPDMPFKPDGEGSKEETSEEASSETDEIPEDFQSGNKTQNQQSNSFSGGYVSFGGSSFSGSAGQTAETYDIEDIVQELKECLPGLNVMISESEITQKLENIAAQQNYDLTMLEAAYAEAVYELTVESLQITLDSANEELDALLDAQEIYESMEGGIICADRSGTLSSVMLDADDRLSVNCELVSYLDTSEISISVEVGQEQIAEFAVGDKVNVMISNQMTSGTVSQIATSATAGRSASSVTYTMIITVDNSRGQYTTGLSATVIASGTDTGTENRNPMGSRPDSTAIPGNIDQADFRNWKKDTDEEEANESDHE